MCSNNDQNAQGFAELYSLALSAAQTRSRFSNDARFCSKLNNRHVVEWMQIGPDISQSCTNLAFTDSSQLSAHLDSDWRDSSQCRPATEIYFIHQKDTWAPLDASREMILTLVDHYNLSSGFLHMLSSFRDRHIPVEEAFPGPSRSLFMTDRSEIGWVYKYSEKKEVKSGNPWRIRQTGIYHVHDRGRSVSTWIIISPSPTAQFKTYLQEILQHAQVRSHMLAHPLLAHTMLISTHLSSWRGYLEYYEDLLINLDMPSACTMLGEPLVSFDTLKDVRAIEKQILPLEPILTSFETLLHDLEHANERFTAVSNTYQNSAMVIQAALDEFQKEAVSYRKQALHLHKIAQSIAQSILDTLNLDFQRLAHGQSKNTFMMARSAREDSVAIRAITFVTSFYLPFSFVATMLGMNLVEFDSKSRNVVVSNQFWIYFVISVPLTAVTLACWKWKLLNYREGYALRGAESVKNTSDIEIV